MGPIHLFDLTSRHAQWLTARQAAIAENVSNANTPGYKAGDVAAFAASFDSARLSLVTTDPLHLGAAAVASGSFAVKDAATWEIHHSGNSVSLEQELMKSSEVNADYSLNRSITKAFNRMLLASLKG